MKYRVFWATNLDDLIVDNVIEVNTIKDAIAYVTAHCAAKPIHKNGCDITLYITNKKTNTQKIKFLKREGAV